MSEVSDTKKEDIKNIQHETEPDIIGTDSHREKEDVQIEVPHKEEEMPELDNDKKVLLQKADT